MAGNNFTDRYVCFTCMTEDPSRHEPGCRDYVQPKPAPAAPPGRPEYQQRVLDELAELEGRHTKLVAFLYQKLRPTVHVDPVEERLLMEQEQLMHAYIGILKKRIARF